jgi:LacI family transcriptional regulator
MPVTIKQIAERSGLSVPTVSQVLNNKGHRYRSETCKRVLKAVRELNYRPNSSARAIRMGRFNCVALLLSTDPSKSFLPNELLRGIHDGVAEHDYHMSLTVLPDQKLTDDGFVPKILRQWMADGLLVNYHVALPPRMVELIHEHGIPSVWINTKQKSDCVYPDDLNASREATEKLLALGHKDVAYADFGLGENQPSTHHSCADRYDGYAQALRAAGLQPRLMQGPDAIPSSERAAFAAKLLAQPSRPTAIVTYSDTTAMPIVQGAASLGLQFPRDLSVVTFYEGLTTHSGIGIASMVIPWHEVGYAAFQMLQEKIKDPAQIQAPRALPFTFEPGQTFGPPGR